MRRFLLALAVVGVLTSCTVDRGEPGTGLDVIENVGSGEADNVSSDDVVNQDVSTTEQSSEVEGSDVDGAEPVVRVPANEGLVSESNWVARTYMDEGQIDIVWSPVDGAETYRLYRLPTADSDYAAIAEGNLDGADEIYEGPEYGYIDRDDIPANTFLTYVLVAELDGSTTEPRWTEALSTADVTAPTPITDLTASVTGDGVLLEWAPSTDDVEFAAYSVLYYADDGSLQYIGGGADESQTSFLDNAPPTGSVTYRVQAFDFHDNGSEFAEITVEVP